MAEAQSLLSRPFATVSDLIAAHARERGDKRALVEGAKVLSYAQLDGLMDRVAFGLQHGSVPTGGAVAIIGATSIAYAGVFLGALRAGCAPTPLSPSATPEQLAGMIEDSGAAFVFADDDILATLPAVSAKRVSLAALDAWLPESNAAPTPVSVGPNDAFNIIYSSGTTGAPKGIVQPHALRWAQIVGYAVAGYGDAVTIVATPLYSNTTLVSFLPTLAYGGTSVLLGKFDALQFLETAERERATHTMLVPVQYQRIMALAEFDRFDLSDFRYKSCTSAPLSPALKADIVARWPGLLVEIYGMTEGGGVTVLVANAFPDKLHTVGLPNATSDIRIINDEGRELPRGEIGEVVGRSAVMMTGYHGRPEATSASEWLDGDGNRFIRHGDIGRFDEDGFLTLLGRSKDMIISGGFNIYPTDIEAVLAQHPQVEDCAVIGVPSETWGETPYAFYVAKGDGIQPGELVAWVNERVGKTQRLSGAEAIAELPRNAIGKVMKRDLRALSGGEGVSQ